MLMRKGELSTVRGSVPYAVSLVKFFAPFHSGDIASADKHSRMV